MHRVAERGGGENVERRGREKIQSGEEPPHSPPRAAISLEIAVQQLLRTGRKGLSCGG